jgi:glucokinase
MQPEEGDMPLTTALAPEPPATRSSSSQSATIGVILAERIYAGLILDGNLVGPLACFPDGPAPDNADDDDSLVELHTDGLVNAICDLVCKVAQGYETALDAVGVALPGLIRNGVIDDAPNLPQLKGARVRSLLSSCLAQRGLHPAVAILNDADAMAAGLASNHGKLDRVIRVWTLGVGIGYGRYPFAEGVWEGGHTTVSLDPRENYCGCGGRGHLEGIMGHRAGLSFLRASTCAFSI